MHEGRGSTRRPVIGANLLPEMRPRETPRDPAAYPAGGLAYREWEERFPNLRCGITTASDGDYGLSRNEPGDLLDAYGALGSRLGFDLVAVGRQVHGAEVRAVEAEAAASSQAGDASPLRHEAGARRGSASAPPRRAGLMIVGELDGLVTEHRGILLASTAADCVPVYLVDPASGAIGLVHAGWRGTSQNILSRGVGALGAMGADPESLHLHLGPAICGSCYEVDAPVLKAFGLDGERGYIDLRGLLTAQARRLGVAAENISASSWCTRCSDGLLHSHRGGGNSAGRMAAHMGHRRASGGD